MVGTSPPKKIHTTDHLKNAVRYDLNPKKTSIAVETITSKEDFPLIVKDGQLYQQLVSGHRIFDLSTADEEMIDTKIAAAFQKGDDDLTELKDNDQILAYHIVQSFAPDDPLTPQMVHEIGKKVLLEFTGGEYEFTIATHVDKAHLHNHIIINSTNGVTLKKMRWKDSDYKRLNAILEKHAVKAGAKLHKPSLRNSYTKYSVWRRQENYRFEIKERLEFLLKHSRSLEDFKAKAEKLSLAVDFSGKYATYRLTDQPQERKARDRSLSKKGRYSLEAITERVKENEETYTLAEIKAEYDAYQAEKANDFEFKVDIEAWQVEQETGKGLYLILDYGALKSGTIFIPAHKVDKKEEGGYTLYLKEKDYFYFLNDQQSEKSRYMMGRTVARQLAKQNGELVIKKNPYISSLRALVADYNFLVKHQVLDGKQFQALEERFNDKVQATHRELKRLDQRLMTYHKLEGAMLALKKTPEHSLPAKLLLKQLHLPEDMTLEDVQQTIREFEIEKGALQEIFDGILKDYTNYQTLKDNQVSRKANDNPSLSQGRIR